MKTDKTDNELINEFMDIKEVTQYFDSYGIKKPIYWAQNNIFRTRTHDAPGLSIKEFINESKYQTSWDWLMPVVEKIEGLGHDVDLYWHSSVRNGNEQRHAVCAIQDRPALKEITSIEGYPMIESVYKAVVEFIKWYSSQPKP